VSKPVRRLVLVAILLAAFALRSWRLDGQELRGDEAFGYFFSLRPYGEIIQATVDLHEPHPVAGYFLQKAWLGWAGDSEFALRFLSLWFGVVAVALLGRFGHSLALISPVPELAAALLALSPYAIWHSQDARMYSMSLALSLGSTWLAVAWLQRRRWPWTVGYLAITWLALHTHYYAAFVVLAQSLFVASRSLPQRRLWNTLTGWISLQLLLALLYLPWLFTAASVLTGYGGNGDSPDLLAALGRALSVFAVGESTPQHLRGWAAIGSALLLALGTMGLLATGAAGRRAVWLLWLYLGTPLLATWWSAQSRPIFNERYLIAAAPPYALLMAAAFAPGISKVWPAALRRAITVGATLLLILLGVGLAGSLQRYYIDPAYSKTRGWRELAAGLTRLSAQLPSETVRLAQNFPDPTLWYYYRGPVTHLVLPPAAHDAAGARAAVATLAATGVERVILPLQPAPQWDDQELAATALAGHYELAATQTIGVWPVQVYVLPPASPNLLAVDFQNGVQLTSFAWQPATLAPHDLLVVHLGWHTGQARLADSIKVFVHLLNAAGVLVTQADRPLTATTNQPTVYALPLPEPLPPGNYQLITGLYDPAQAGAPRIPLTGGDDTFVLTELFVGPQP
jgi:hypothetical protein